MLFPLPRAQLLSWDMLLIAYIALPEFKTKKKDDPPSPKKNPKQKTKTKQNPMTTTTQKQQQTSIKIAGACLKKRKSIL